MDLDAQELRKYCHFAALSDEALRALARRLEPVEVPAGTVIVAEGTAGDSFYFLVRGEVEVGRRNALGRWAVLANLQGRETFGEMALLTGAAREATVAAITDVSLLRLPKEDFETAVLREAGLRGELAEGAASRRRFDGVKELDPFARLDPEQAVMLEHCLREERFGPEEDIVTQGRKGGSYYIVKTGSVAVVKQPPEGRAEIVAVLGPEEGFGEEALLTDSARSATVRTIEETTVWVLDREHFDAVLRRSYLRDCAADEALALQREGWRILDVRTPSEFAEERIPEAVNLPLDELRQECGRLDASRGFVVCCLSGARSAIAAFLLAMRGLRAVNLKGGLLGWGGPLLESSGAGVHVPHPSG